MIWPGDLGRWPPVWGRCLVLWLSWWLPVVPSRGRGPVGAPGAAQRRGRTSWMPAGGGRSSGARKSLLRGLLDGEGGWLFAPVVGGRRSGLTCTHSAPAWWRGRWPCHLGTGLLSHVIERGGCRLMRYCELARGLV